MMLDFLFVKTLLNLFYMQTLMLNNLRAGSFVPVHYFWLRHGKPLRIYKRGSSGNKNIINLWVSAVWKGLYCLDCSRRSFLLLTFPQSAFAVSAHTHTHTHVTRLTRSGLQTAPMISISSAAPCTSALWPGTLSQPRWWSWCVTVSRAGTRRRAQPGGLISREKRTRIKSGATCRDRLSIHCTAVTNMPANTAFKSVNYSCFTLLHSAEIHMMPPGSPGSLDLFTSTAAQRGAVWPISKGRMGTDDRSQPDTDLL